MYVWYVIVCAYPLSLTLWPCSYGSQHFNSRIAAMAWNFVAVHKLKIDSLFIHMHTIYLQENIFFFVLFFRWSNDWRHPFAYGATNSQLVTASSSLEKKKTPTTTTTKTTMRKSFFLLLLLFDFVCRTVTFLSHFAHNKFAVDLLINDSNDVFRTKNEPSNGLHSTP